MHRESLPKPFNFYGRLEDNSLFRNYLFNSKALDVNINAISMDPFRWPSV